LKLVVRSQLIFYKKKDHLGRDEGTKCFLRMTGPKKDTIPRCGESTTKGDDGTQGTENEVGGSGKGTNEWGGKKKGRRKGLPESKLFNDHRAQWD